VYPKGWDVQSTFSELHGTVAAYVSAPIPTEPTIALRVGGKRVWGTYPFHEAAYVGGASDLRGFREQRFAGDAAVFGNAELRLFLSRFNALVPGRLGIFGFADAGRVFYGPDPAAADSWHAAVGGGVWISVIDPRHMVSIAVAHGDDLTGVYVRAGFMF
jgi:hemolysin activation/secretion protein